MSVRASRFAVLVVPAGLVVLAAAVVTACTTDYQKGVDDPLFGAPNALSNERAPGPTSDSTGADGGLVTPGTGGPNIACVKNGGALLDAGPCAVSFKTDVLDAFGRAGCAQSSACHGGVNPTNPPRIEPSDGPGMWTEFAAFKLSDGKSYINPCSTDKTQAGMGCNLYAANGCGVHMPSGGQMAQADIDKIDTWIACGSPNN